MHGSTVEQIPSATTYSGQQTDHRTPISNDRAVEQPEQRLRLLPKESGVALMGFGIIGVLLLDPFDIVFVLVGALVFTPTLFQRTEHWVQARFPRLHREGRRHIDRYIDDFERRFPPNRR